MFELGKKRYSTDTMVKFYYWCKNNAIDVQWADIYMFKLPNIQIMEHLVAMANIRYKNGGPVPPANCGVRVVFYVSDDLI